MNRFQMNTNSNFYGIQSKLLPFTKLYPHTPESKGLDNPSHLSYLNIIHKADADLICY